MREQLKLLEKVALSSCFRFLLCKKFIASNARIKEKQNMLEMAKLAASKALDLRTLLKMQSVVLALARVVFSTPELYDLALLQRHGRVL